MEETTFTDTNIDRIRIINGSSLVDYLSSAYELLSHIVSYLSLKDLDVAYEVFEKWRPVLEVIRKEKKIIDTYVFVKNHKEDYQTWPEAELCITFCKKRNEVLEKKLKRYNFNKSGHFLVVRCREGVIGTNRDYSQLIYSRRDEKSITVTHIRIPNFRDVGVKKFVWDNSVSIEDFCKSFSLPDNKIIKCVLVFMSTKKDDPKWSENLTTFLSHLQSTQKQDFAIGGGLIDSLFNDPKALCTYIIFYGDKVEATSIILNKFMETKEEIESQVKILKESSPDTDRGVLFVFTCCTRTLPDGFLRRTPAKTTFEADAIHKFFPSTPIIGCLAYGEIGKKHPEIKPRRVWKPFTLDGNPRTFESRYSTVLVYLGFYK